MPLDATGTFRHNTESARMHTRAAGKNPDEQEGQSTGDHTEVHDHGDGTFHTVHPEHGEVQHESIGHMHAHLSSIHGQEGHKHFHAHHDGASVHSHSAGSGEETDSRDHEDTEGAAEHMHEALGGAAGEEDGGEEEQPSGEGEGLGGLY